MRRTNQPPMPRRGAATVEAALTIPVFLVLVLGTIDLGIGVSRHNTLAQAARHGARQAVVHGKLSRVPGSSDPAWQTVWGPTSIDAQADATGIPAVDAVRPMLANCPLDESRVRFVWLDNDNDHGSRVQVTVTSTYRPIVTFIFGNPAIPLSASSTMLIAH